MNDWKKYRLSDIVEIYGGGTPKTNNSEYWDGDIPWLSVGDYNTNQKYVYETDRKISNLGLKNSSTKLLNAGDVIISARGTVGVVAMLGRAMAFNQTSYGIRAIEGITFNDFVYYLLKNSVENFLKVSYGAVFNTITRNTFNEIEICLPPLPEQYSIANILSSLDDKIELLHRQNETLETLAQTLFRQWLIEEAQDDWEEGKLGDLVEFNYGKGLKKSKRTGTGYPVVGSSGIVDYHAEYLVEGPGIVTGRKGTLGEVIYFSENFYPIDTTFFVKTKKDSPNLYYEYYLLKSIGFKNMNTDSAVPGLNRDNAISVEVIIPPQYKITQFNDFVHPLFQKRKANQTQIHTLEKLRDILLRKLLNGDVQLQGGHD